LSDNDTDICKYKFITIEVIVRKTGIFELLLIYIMIYGSILKIFLVVNFDANF